jgi:hypothetical protein
MFSLRHSTSTQAHLAGTDDGLVSVRPVLDRMHNLRELLSREYGDSGQTKLPHVIKRCWEVQATGVLGGYFVPKFLSRNSPVPKLPSNSRDLSTVRLH